MTKVSTDYAAIEATSLKDGIIQKLNDAGVLTDQNYEGSNITQLINILSYTNDVLMFYLNKTSNETLFSEAEIYENLNRLVKGLNYKPVGFQTSTLSFSLSASSSLSVGSYTIPRYSYFRIGNYQYSFMDDVPFTKTLSGSETFDSISDNFLLYQGKVIEFPEYYASGNVNETIILGTNGEKVDNFNIHVYIKNDTTDLWEQWERVDSLYDKNPYDKCYEVRFGPKKDYEILFGDDINGKSLELNQQVAIYYLLSDGENAQVGVNSLEGLTLIPYSSVQYNSIVVEDLLSNNTVLTKKGMSYLQFNNDYISSEYTSEQSVSDIKKYAPLAARSKNRLVTKNDYKSYVMTNFRNILLDSQVLSNNDYINKYVKYFYNTGIKTFNTESRQLLSQLKFSTSCNFNNIYIVSVPRNYVNTSKQYINFLTTSQKNLIKNSCEKVKMEGAEIIPIDPIYISFSFGTIDDSITLDEYVASNSTIEIVRQSGTKFSDDYIKESFANIILNYFNPTSLELGQTININSVNSDLLKINGLDKFYTKNSSASYEGLSFISWNDVYKKSYEIVNKNKTLEIFQFPYLNLNKQEIISKITII